MSEVSDRAAGANPFSTRYVRPGAIPFFFPPGEDCNSLLKRLEHNGWFGQIIGPHGGGKSALVAALADALKARGKPVELITLHDGQRSLPGERDLWRDLGEGTLLIVDGYEQLSFWSRQRLRRQCRRRGLGLLVTSHRPVGLPDLFRAIPSADLAEQIVRYLLREANMTVDRRQVQQQFAKHRGDLREMLFELYDAYELRRRASP